MKMMIRAEVIGDNAPLASRWRGCAALTAHGRVYSKRGLLRCVRE